MKRTLLAVVVLVVAAVPLCGQSEKEKRPSFGNQTAAADQAQSKPTPKKNSESSSPLDLLEDFDRAKFDAGFSKTRWALSLEHQDPKYPAKTARDLSADLEKPKTFDDHEQLRPYKGQLSKLPEQIGVLGGSITYFLYGSEDSSFPFRLVRYKETKCFIAYLASGSIYNTLRLSSAKQRAAKAASSHGLPTLRELARAFRETDIQTLAVFVTYGTKDFLAKSVLATKPEVLGIVISKSDVQAFADSELSDTELLKKALILLSDRDAVFEFTKVELQLD